MPDEPVASRDPVTDAMAELRDGEPRVRNEPADRYWLRMGLALGLRQPDRAQPLLDGLEVAAGLSAATAPERERAPVAESVDAGPVDGGDVGLSDAGVEAPAAGAEVDVPLRSMLLARSATLPAMDKEAFDPDAVFGWATRVTRDEVLWMGRVVEDMLAEGLTPDLTKGFAITWRAGVRLPDSDFDLLFHAFTELELTVGGVLAGYDLRTQSRESKPGWIGSMLGSLMPRSDTRTAQAGGILERAGKPGQRGLVAMWNAWAGLRFREQVPPEVFEQLLRPWVTVVGRLPEP